MAEPFLSEIRIFSFTFPPKGWAFCNGQFLPINQNQALFALIGTEYGGNGQTNFALPDLRGRAPIHFGNSRQPAESGGQAAVTVTIQQLPTHTHTLNAQQSVQAASLANQDPAGKQLAGAKVALQGGGEAAVALYATPTNLTPMSPSMSGVAGGSQPHNNMMPYLALNFCIATEGIFPPRN